MIDPNYVNEPYAVSEAQPHRLGRAATAFALVASSLGVTAAFNEGVAAADTAPPLPRAHVSIPPTSLPAGMLPPTAGRLAFTFADGSVFTEPGNAGNAGSVPFGQAGNSVVGITAVNTHNNDSYDLVTAAGKVYPFGGAGFYGDMSGAHLNRPVVGIAATPDGRGYWEVAADGGVFAFGDAGFYGSMGNVALNQPVVGIASTPDGDGYWEVAADGGVFAFGDAGFYGSTGGMRLNQPVMGIMPDTTGRGYTLGARDGGTFTFGDAPYYGSVPAAAPFARQNGYVSIVRLPLENGYALVNSAGDTEVFAPGAAAPVEVPTIASRPDVPVVGAAELETTFVA